MSIVTRDSTVATAGSTKDPPTTLPTNLTPIPKKKADPRLKALQRFALSISVLTIAGHLFLGFEQSPVTPVATLAFAYVMEVGLEVLDARLNERPLRFDKRSPRSVMAFLLPAHITALACAMLLYAGPVLWPYLLATALAITVKYMIKAPVNGRWRHVMNPSNFGIACVLLLAPWVGIAPPYMFTANVTELFDWLVPLVVVVLGTMLNTKLTGKWPLIVGWVGGFIAQAALRSLLEGGSFVAAISPLTGVAFILFTNYMITDPGTTPRGRRNQLFFGVGCAAWYGVLMTFHVVFGLFFALVATCLTRACWLLVIHMIRRRE